MVSSNPLFRKWSIKKFQATVINDIWVEVAFFSLVATMVCLVSDPKIGGHNLGINNGLLTVLGTVLGLVISFRTSSAYERYQDGRKMWTNIITASRNLAQMLWIHVPVDRKGKGELANATMLQNTIEKKTMINLIGAYSVAVKHFLRGERGVYYEDLYPLLSFLPRFADGGVSGPKGEELPLWHDDDEVHHGIEVPVTELGRNSSNSSNTEKGVMDPEKALPNVASERTLKPARNPPEETFYDYIPLFRFFRWIVRSISKRARARPERKQKRKAYDGYVESHIPLEITLVLSNYTAWCMKNGLMQPAIATGATNNLTMLMDTVSNLERICNTPLPFAYQAHLRMSLWLYLFFLPFQIYAAFKYIAIPGTAFASFLLLGFLEIGQEIENPFNYDLNDLDLDYFCHAVQRELHLITAYPNPDPRAFLFTELNQPFAPVDRRTAKQLAEGGDNDYHLPNEKDAAQPGIASLRRTLVKSWKVVDSITKPN
ncbi:Bestrophin, RFP-TM, chloride channel-domain-containing protein [Crepidotus variabilis]|uniref:Bestrophin, RFP-TM, chloride channel-domain-containing protein n=1 Tax=Crepidotus variabilis TaxID=179855 RepID=A0A9P6E9U4_9AGAR|nr:Bestrophin, RFP-TM, chloride channel-domain-containing protein [Crepidotus variabilis]